MSQHGLEKKEKKGPRKFKDEWSAIQAMIIGFWDCWGLVYAEFDLDARKEEQNVTQNTYFDTLMHLTNATWSKWQDCCQKVILIHKNACLYRTQFDSDPAERFSLGTAETPSVLTGPNAEWPSSLSPPKKN